MSSARKFKWQYLVAALLLWAFFAQTVRGMVAQSPTVDEQAHLMRGYLYLKLGTPVFQIGHPILADALAGLPLRLLTNLDIPPDEAAFAANDWGNYSDRFVWRRAAAPGANVEQIFFLSRLMVVALGLALAALTFRWAGQLWGANAGLAALVLFVFDPTIVAHSQLVTHDVPVALFYVAATYGLWRYLEDSRARNIVARNYVARNLVLTGVLFGLAQGSKFAALTLGPLFVVLVGVWPFLRKRIPNPARSKPDRHNLYHQDTKTQRTPSLSKILCVLRAWAPWWLYSCAGIFAVAGVTVWALYGFEVRSIPGVPLPLPAAGYFQDLLWEARYFTHDRYFFLNGQYSATGWWYYFPLAFALKTPLPAMVLIGASLSALRRSITWPRLTALLLPALVYLASTLVSPLYIGYRYFITALPYVYVLCGRWAISTRRGVRWALLGLLAWSTVSAARIQPDQLAYFNELIGGPENGWRYLADSNIDWGQSLPALRDLIRREQLGKVKLSYFGSAHPSYYGIEFEPLPAADLAPERGHPATSAFYPPDPAPGVYAISASSLQGIELGPERWDTFRYFRDKPPFAKAGYSIFLYRVEPSGLPVDVVLTGLPMDELSLPSFAAFGTNDVRPRWNAPRASLVIPAQPAWYATRGNAPGDVAAEGLSLSAWGWRATRPCATTAGEACQLYPPDAQAHAGALARIDQWRATSPAWHSPLLVPTTASLSAQALPVNLGDQVQFLGYEWQKRSTELELLTAWRVTAQPRGPRAIFFHALDPAGRVATQWDGLDVPTEGWRVGDTFVQRVTLTLPANVQPGQYWLQIGMYDPAKSERLPVLVDGQALTDRIVLDKP